MGSQKEAKAGIGSVPRKESANGRFKKGKDDIVVTSPSNASNAPKKQSIGGGRQSSLMIPSTKETGLKENTSSVRAAGAKGRRNSLHAGLPSKTAAQGLSPKTLPSHKEPVSRR